MTIYLPEALANRVKAADINVSGVCQDALTRELNRLDAIKQLDESDAIERVEVYDDQRGRGVAFFGQILASDDRDRHGVYRTRRGRIAVHDVTRDRLYDYDDFKEFAADFEAEQELVADVAAALGEDYTILLDI